MLERTFIHIPGVGEETERSLWRQGCLTWHDLLAEPDRFSCGTAGRTDVCAVVEKSVQSLAAGEHQFFRRALGTKEAWRAFPEFRHSCVYLDIETDGGQSGESITTIGMYDGENFTCLVKGRDLENFRDLITNYSMIVTFFGTSFDLPMLQRRFRDVQFDQIHLDLCPTLRRLGYRGGLKKIEKQLGIARDDDTDGLNGLDAIRLWRRYRQLRDENALETLIAYNREDVVNMVHLAEVAYGGLQKAVLRENQQDQ
ncbi:MAG: ribonuclease H-like domain-containing protein [Fimbriimonas sp.]